MKKMTNKQRIDMILTIRDNPSKYFNYRKICKEFNIDWRTAKKSLVEAENYYL